MAKKDIVYLSIVIIFGLFIFTDIDTSLLKAQPPQPPPGNPNPGPPAGTGNFAPLDASYVVTELNGSLTNEVLTTNLITDLIPVSSSKNVGSTEKPWGSFFGLLGQFSELVTQKVSSFANIILEPSSTGKVKIGGQSLVVAPLPSDPPSAENGQIYYNTILNKFRIFENGSFRNIDGISVPIPSPGPTFIQAAAGENISANDLVYIATAGEIPMDFNYNLNNSLQSTDTSVVRTQEFVTRSPVKIKALSFYIQRLAIRERGGTLSFKILDKFK